MIRTVSLWVKAGNQFSNAENFSATRINNIIALIFALTLTAQLPFMPMFWHKGGNIQCIINVIAILCCSLVPVFSHLKHPFASRVALVSVYISYLVVTAIHLGSLANVHYFFLLGVFATPFIFQTDSPVTSRSIIILFGLLTILFGFLNPSTTVADLGYVELVSTTNLINLVIAGMLCAFYIQVNTQIDREKVNHERKRSENLLLNILPAPIARRLKESNQPVADYFDEATILFADISNFTELSRQKSPVQLVTLLNDLYSEFDLLLDRFRLEKIKTIGDEIMAVCGVPNCDNEHAILVCECALEMQQCFDNFCLSHQLSNGLRIGINSGPVVAGVIGKNKFSYDLWGESVNMASRLESSGESHRIQISQQTYDKVKHRFVCEPRGNIEVKGMGTVQSYWLIRSAPNKP
ncbi:adenylate/guanylate cyclase domain-containing protein [Neptunicella marina]|uniref:Adenylate/guanylate cyclase domain-containing protein n=1 Tax=Neptunicella marina TaxID=2125989 RepID=A0A8J6IR39_9ALTE|nr:adenylate/guanylate cyclase domain-containing protein [Neptunicella marina]MBC3764292.1 adenylate/guanylate cyclase domain-containing protein [Neptunicella marina]